MQYSIWNGIKNPIGIVQIICDSNDKNINCDDFAMFLHRNQYLVYCCDKKNALDFKSAQYNLPIFLIGVGRAAETVQNITCNTDIYAGGVSMMAHTPITRRMTRMSFFSTRQNNTPKSPLLVVGNFSTIKQIQSYINLDYGNEKLHNLNMLIYPDISRQNAFEITQDEILDFFNSKNKKLH